MSIQDCVKGLEISLTTENLLNENLSDASFASALQFSYDDLQSMTDQQKTKAGINIPLASGLLGLSGSNEESRSIYNRLRTAYQSATSQAQKTSVLSRVYHKFATPEALSAYQECLKESNAKESSKLILELAPNDATGTFIATLTYDRKEAGDPTNLLINQIIVNGAKPVGESEFIDGMTIGEFDTVGQLYIRDGLGGVTFVVLPDGAKGLVEKLDPIPSPPSPDAHKITLIKIEIACEIGRVTILDPDVEWALQKHPANFPNAVFFKAVSVEIPGGDGRTNFFLNRKQFELQATQQSIKKTVEIFLQTPPDRRSVRLEVTASTNSGQIGVGDITITSPTQDTHTSPSGVLNLLI